MKAAPHVVIEGTALCCRACGNRELLEMPVRLSELLVTSAEFVARHQRCATQTQGGERR